jgi:hypothetical protein
MEYKCEICNHNYKSYQSLWNHKNKFHLTTKTNNNKKEEISDNKKYTCSKCLKEFKHFQSRWRHEKTCNKNETNIFDSINELKNKIIQLESKPNIVNYNTTNNTQNIIISSPPGLESIQELNIQQKKFIMNKGLSSLLYLIETTNFSKELPENHSYCVTSLNDKHASIIDTKTNSIIKADKIELFDKILAGNLKKLEQICTDKSFSKKEVDEFIKILERLKNILFNGKKGMKKYYNEINLLSYNNKDLILETWNSLKKLDEIILKISDKPKINNFENYNSESSDIESDEEVNSKKIEDFRKKFIKPKPIIQLKESDDDSDDESDSDIVNEILIRDKPYILEGTKVYIKTKKGFKGDLYGTYFNGKVKKIKEIIV